MSRPICTNCKKSVLPINYHKGNKVYYRKFCTHCLLKLKKPKTEILPNWHKTGYRKKLQCDKCGFKSKINNQIVVVYTDGNPVNSLWTNLKSVCLNCNAEILSKGFQWKPGDLVKDF